MTRTRFLIAALLLGTVMFFTGSSAEARPIYARHYGPVYVAPRVVAPTVYYPGHFHSFYYGRRWYR